MIDPPAETVRSPRATNDSFASWFALGDVDGNGTIDMVTGDPAAPGTDIETGIVDVFLGHAGRLGPSPAQSMLNPLDQRDGWFGASVVVCDFDSDGFDDRAAAATRNADPSIDQGMVYIFAGGPTLTTTPITALASPTNQATDVFGIVLSCGR